MQTADIEDLEKALARLMPRSMSEGGSRAIEDMLDELAGPISELEAGEAAEPVAARGRWKFAASAGIAAGIALVAAFSWNGTRREGGDTGGFAEREETPGWVVVGEEDRIEDMVEEGWMSDAEGATMQAVRMRVVQENTLRDEETGLVFQLTEPREEMVLIPVSSF